MPKIKMKKADSWKKNKIINLIRHRQGDDNILMTGLVFWIYGIDWSEEMKIAYEEMRVDSVCSTCWIPWFKEYHNMLRKNGSIDSIQLIGKDKHNLMYIQQLYGRMGGELNWSSEIEECMNAKKRKYIYQEGKWEDAQSCIRREMDKIFDSIPNLGLLETWDDYWKRRHEWLASGSAGVEGKILTRSILKLDLDIEVKSSEIKSNKRSIAERMTLEEVRSHSIKSDDEERPSIEAKGHTKPEIASVRGIYGVSMLHYLTECWPAAILESGLRDKRLDLGIEEYGDGSNYLRLDKLVQEGKWLNSFDFSHMDKQHSEYSLVDFFLSARSAIARKASASPSKDEILEVLNWLSEAVRNQWLTTPDGRFKIEGTMFTGCRFTMLINTVCNIAYMNILRRSVHNMYGTGVDSFSIHRGDDVVLEVDYTEGLLINSWANMCNIECRESKLLMDQSCEYLRNSYEKKGNYGSLTRSIASYISGNWESDCKPTPDSRIQAMHENLSLMIRRGLDEGFAESIFAHDRVYYGKIGREESSPILSGQFANLEVGSGGLGLAKLDGGGILRIIEGSDKLLTIGKHNKRRIAFSRLKSKKLASTDYTNHLIGRFKGIAVLNVKDRPRLISKLMENTVGLEIANHLESSDYGDEDIDELNRIVTVCKFREIKLNEYLFVKNDLKIERLLNNTRLRNWAYVEKVVAKASVLLPYFEKCEGKRTKDMYLALIGSANEQDLDRILRSMVQKFDRIDNIAIPGPLVGMIRDWYWLGKSKYELQDWSNWLSQVIASNADAFKRMHL